MGETFGESVALISEPGVAAIRGLHGPEGEPASGVAACAKHYAAGGTPENGANFAPMDVSERTLRETYLEPFRQAVDAGVRTFMAAHNEINGIPCHGNSWLLDTVLRGEWEFAGLVVSDWTDMHMHGPGFFESILDAVEAGRIPESRVDEAAARILTLKHELGLFEAASAPEGETNLALRFPDHDDLALDAARQSIVLLTNDGVLPVRGGRIMVTGPNASDQSILGDWAAKQPAENVTTTADGLAAAAASVVHVPCEQAYHISDETIAAAASAAKKANVAVVVVSGRALICDFAYSKANAVLYAFEPGARGGRALAEVILGIASPSGRLPVTIPRSVGHIPQYHDHPEASYFRGYVDAGEAPWFAFGHGLCYTSFEYADLNIAGGEGSGPLATATVTITNTGDREGEDIVLAYARDVLAGVTRPVRSLAAFSRVSLAPGESRQVDLPIRRERFELVNAACERVLEPGEFEISVGPLVATIVL